MKIALCYNPKKVNKSYDNIVCKFKQLLTDNKIEYFDFDKSNKRCADLIAVLGGDGTILAHAQYATENNIPILAINVGTVGFLSSYEEKDLEIAVKTISEGNFTLTEKTALCVQTNDGEEYFALNDAVIERKKIPDDYTVVSKLDFAIDGNSVYKLSADGIIIATPTGSTAYSLSAGGVVLTPDLHSFIATPICSHSLYTRPIVFRDDKEISITVMKNSCSSVLTLDGRGVKKLKQGDKITVKKHKNTLKIVDCGEDFFDRLIRKLGK